MTEFEKLDTDQNGSLSKDEFEKLNTFRKNQKNVSFQIYTYFLKFLPIHRQIVKSVYRESLNTYQVMSKYNFWNNTHKFLEKKFKKYKK